jgi:hypothetical protein
MAIYKIVSHGGSGLPLNVYGSGTITGRRNVCIWSDTGSVDQQWSIASLGSNQTVKSVNNTNYMLNAYRTNWNCDVYTLNSDSYVNFISLGSDLYRIQLKSTTTRYLTATGTTSNSNVDWQALNSTSSAQKWKITVVGGGTNSKILTIPTDRICNWNQKNIAVTQYFGTSACTLVTGLDVANFYSTNTNGYIPENMNSTTYWGPGGYTREVPGPGTIGDMVCENTTKQICLARIKSEIDNGKPVVVNIGSVNDNHTLFAYGYVNSASDYSDIKVFDPANLDTSSIYGRIVDLYNAMDYNGDKFTIWSLRLTYSS